MQPSWLYQHVDIPKLDRIVQELQCALPFFLGNVNDLQPDFVYVLKDKIASHLPVTSDYLQQMGLLDRWRYLAFITGNRGQSLDIHVDTLDFTTRCYALNIPVLNCNNTYTVFYQAQTLDHFTDKDDPRASAIRCDPATAVEIGRVELDRPNWTNITIPHQPVMNHDLPRVLASFRFSPEVHDLFTPNIL